MSDLPDTTEAMREDHHAIPEAGVLGRVIVRVAFVPAIGIIAAMLILIQEVVLRYVFGAPTIWAHETTVFLCGIAFIFGGLLCSVRDRHIRVVLLYDLLSPRWRRNFDVVISAICGLASAAFAWASWVMVQRAVFRPDGSFHLETSGSAWNPPYPGLIKIFLMLTMAIMAIQFTILAVSYAKGRR